MQQRKLLSSDQLCVDSVDTFNIMAAMTSYNEFHLVVSNTSTAMIQVRDREGWTTHIFYLPLPRTTLKLDRMLCILKIYQPPLDGRNPYLFIVVAPSKVGSRVSLLKE